MPTLSNNGLAPHPSFPSHAYESVHATVSNRWATSEYYEHYSGAWNALAYRFQGAIEAGEEFQQSLRAHGAHPEASERYHQERALFDFFCNGFSAFEASFYGLFAIGAFIDSKNFQLATPRGQQRVSPSHVADTIRRAFPSDALIEVLAVLFADQAYQRWREVRNVLTHRTAPGRRLFVSLGEDDTPPVEWKLNDLPLDETLIPNRQAELAQLVSDMLSGIDRFLAGRI